MNARLWNTGKTWKPFPTQCRGGARRISRISLYLVPMVSAADDDDASALLLLKNARAMGASRTVWRRTATGEGKRRARGLLASAANIHDRARRSDDATRSVTLSSGVLFGPGTPAHAGAMLVS